MSTRLFIEMGEPKRALLIMSTTDMLECKIVGASALNYDTHTFSGEIRVKDIPWERMDPGFIEKIKRGIDFPSLTDAQDLMDKIHKAIPESKPDEPPKIVKLPLVVTAPHTSEVDNVEVIVESIKGQPAAKAPGKVEKPIVIKDLADLKTAVNNQPKQQLSKKERKKLEEQNRLKQIAQAKADKERLAKAVMSNTPQSVKKEEVKHVVEEVYVKTIMEKHPTGFVIAVKFNNKENQPELLIVSTPSEDGNWETSLPMIFATEQSAKFVFEALLRHPRYSKLMGGKGEVMPIADIDLDSRKMEVALIKNGLSFVNSISK